jgi:peptidoglycan-N-acetylglucosamine deacetylase
VNIDFVKAPFWLRWSVPWMRWKFQSLNEIYLTFDDGPTPGVTEPILEVLEQYQAKATFFCIGQHVEQHPDLVRRIESAGHTLGNHTYSHINGWNCSPGAYLRDVDRAQKSMSQIMNAKVQWFRPPFGRIGILAMFVLMMRYKIAMWEVTAMDYRTDLNAQQIYDIVIQNAGKGSVVLLHDSDLAAPRVLPALPRILDHFRSKGMAFKRLA